MWTQVICLHTGFSNVVLKILAVWYRKLRKNNLVWRKEDHVPKIYPVIDRACPYVLVAL